VKPSLIIKKTEMKEINFGKGKKRDLPIVGIITRQPNNIFIYLGEEQIQSV
jgi:hypothetical protein